MTLDDDSILSAYLDGELGSEQQQAVESAVVADPRLAEELRDLALLRELLAGLPRQAPADVTARVMRRVRHRARLARAGRSLALGPVRAAALAAAIAASVLLMLVIPWRLRHDGRVPAGGHAPDPLAPRQALVGARRLASEHLWPRFSSHPAGRGTTAPLGPGE